VQRLHRKREKIMANKTNKNGCIYNCSYGDMRKKNRAADETEIFDPFDSLSCFDEFDSKIEFYGKKADKTKAEYEAMTDEEKREYILLQYKPICFKAAKKYNYDGAEFQDMYIQACIEILEVIDEYGLDDEDLSYHILSRVGVNVKRSGKTDRQEHGNLSFDDEKAAGVIEVSLADFDLELKEAELFDELSSCLSGRQFEIACHLAKCGKQTEVALAKEFGVTRQTIAKDLTQIRTKLTQLYAA